MSSGLQTTRFKASSRRVADHTTDIMPGPRRPPTNQARGKSRKSKKQTTTAGHTTDGHSCQPIPPRYFPPPSPPALERTLSRILLLRYHQDVARLYSRHLVRVCEDILPLFMLDIITLSGPGWFAANARDEEVKNFLRGALAMDLRQAGERVGNKSLIWSYTAVRDFVSLSLSGSTETPLQAHVDSCLGACSRCWYLSTEWHTLLLPYPVSGPA